MRTGLPIDGRTIQSERTRELRVYQRQFMDRETFVFVPEPGQPGASEAFMSAREKMRVFSAAGLRCTIVRLGDKYLARALDALLEGTAFYVVQRPLVATEIIPHKVKPLLDLDASASGSALTETVFRLVRPFLRTDCSQGRKTGARIGIIGCHGFFGREISTRLTDKAIPVCGIDQGGSPETIADTQILISAVGRGAVIQKELLGKRKELLIDVGYHYDESSGRGFGDFDPACYERADYYTPVPGGVGPLQVLTLAERAVQRICAIPYQPWALTLHSDQGPGVA